MRTIGMVLCVLACASAAGAAGEVKMSEPIRMGFAGVSLALPAGYEIMGSGDPYLAIQASRREQDEDVMLVKLSAWPVGASLDAVTFINAHNSQFDKQLSVRELKVVKSMPLKVAGLDGVAQIQTYTARGTETLALRLSVVRPIAGIKPERAMGYMLAIEADKAHRGDAMPTLRAMLPTIKLFDPVAPVTEAVEALGPPITNKTWGYVIRPPLLWKARQLPRGPIVGVEMLQTDYVSGPRPGGPTPRGFMTVRREERDAEACGVAQLQELAAKMRENQEVSSILHQGKAKVAGVDGHEFLVRTISTQPGAERKSTILAQRNVCVRGLRYSLTLVYQSDSEKIAHGAMEKIAAGMELFKAAGTAPTTAPATTTAPK